MEGGNFLNLSEQQLLIVKVLFILLITFVLARVLNSFYKRIVARRTEAPNENLTTYKFLEHSISVIVYLIGVSFAIYHIPFLKPVAQSMVAGAGILAIAVGFAAQQSLGNIISGIFIIISKPYLIHDRISFKDGLRGVVEDISLRHTVIRNFENQRIIIPNSIISNEVLINSNFLDDKVCRLIDIGISYNSDIDLAKKIISEEVEKHPLNIDIRTPKEKKGGNPRVTTKVVQLAESSVILRIWAWAEDPADGFNMECDLLESIKKRFDAEGVVIPFPQRTISYLESGKETGDSSPQKV